MISHKETIEKIKDLPDYEALGDSLFFIHPDRKARATWAFYRPSGSHPCQIEDSDPLVSIMAFNHSRLRQLERFTKLHSDVIKNDELRVMVAKRARMLFRALADEDFSEMVGVLRLFPIYLPLAIDQVCNGRKMNDDVEINYDALSEFLEMVGELSPQLKTALKLRLKNIKNLLSNEVVEFYKQLKSKKLHPYLVKHFSQELDSYLKESTLHLLQKIALTKACTLLPNN